MPTDADRFARKASTAASEAERAAWLAAAAAAGERDRLRAEADALASACVFLDPPYEDDPPDAPERWLAVVPKLGDDDWEPICRVSYFSTEPEAVAAVRRAAGLDTGGGGDG